MTGLRTKSLPSSGWSLGADYVFWCQSSFSIFKSVLDPINISLDQNKGLDGYDDNR